ncbi:MAG: DUF192 domain-containing protein [Actinobacteria bacterium]|jgi:hypothetical protein|nr:DUF192 domain-containing protein [Actinomycetota bacterium]
MSDAQSSSDTGGYWLLRSGVVLSSVEVMDGFFKRSVGLLGRKSYDGAILFPHTRAVHTLGMKMGIDVAFLDRNLNVISITTMYPWRIGLPRSRARYVLEAETGTFERWHLAVGDILELRESRSSSTR